MAQMAARPTRPPTTIPPIEPGLTVFPPELAAAWVGMVEVVEEEEEEEEEVVVDEEVMLDVMDPLR